MKRYDVINRFIKERDYKSYLEIGRRSGTTFDTVQIDKVSVDPNVTADYNLRCTSDEFFKDKALPKFDIIFIDGLHHADQVKRDIENSLMNISLNGVIILHDCNPAKKEWQVVPQSENKSLPWNGDVWRAFVGYQGIKTCIDTDHGIGIIEAHNILPFDATPAVNISNITYDEFTDNRKELLNLISVYEFENSYFNLHKFI